MSETADRYRRAAAGFTERVAGVPQDAWDRPSPCEGWVARDVVQHVVDATGFFLARVDLSPPTGPAVAEDPMGAWTTARDALQTAVDDPARADAKIESPMGDMTFGQFVGMFGVGDALIHTWDLARATGQDEALDAELVHGVLSNMLPNDTMMRGGGAFGPRVEVPEDADEQTQLIAFTGRTP
jgi:uncharacterized protein (TIGR03086 family)